MNLVSFGGIIAIVVFSITMTADQLAEGNFDGARREPMLIVPFWQRCRAVDIFLGKPSDGSKMAKYCVTTCVNNV